MKILKIFLFVLLNFYFIQSNEQTFNNALADLEDLESYIKEYITEKSYKETSLTHLIVCYIRLGAYTSGNWELTGNIPEDLAEYKYHQRTKKMKHQQGILKNMEK